MIQHLIKSVDYLSYHLKMKKTEHLNFKELYTKTWNKRLQCINWSQKIFWCSNKKQRKTFKKIIEMSKNSNCTAGNLLDYE